MGDRLFVCARQGGDEVTLCLDAKTGGELWRDQYAAQAVTGAAARHPGPRSSPAVAEGKVVTLGAGGVVSCLDAASGKLVWRKDVFPGEVPQFFTATSPLIVDGQIVIYTGQGSGTRAVEVRKEGDGFAAKEQWSNPELGTGYNTPVLKDGLLYGLSDRGYLFCLNARTGQTAWVDSTKRPNFGSVLDAGAVLLALASDSELLAYQPSDKEYTEKARIKVAETPTYAHPVVAGNRVFVRDQETVASWTMD